LLDATQARRAAIKTAGLRPPDWYPGLADTQQEAIKTTAIAAFVAQSRLDKTMSALESIEAFTEKQLLMALKDRFDVVVDVNKTMVCLRHPLEIGVLEVEISSFELMKLSLVQAALHNFEEYECREGAFHRESGFVIETATPGSFHAAEIGISVRQFLGLCRTLDIGAQYQTRLQAFFQSTDALRKQFIASQKATLRVAAEVALLKKDIEPDDYRMILEVVEGEIHPELGGRKVWFRDLSLMRRRMTGCVVFSISEQYRYTSDFIVYIPHDPEHPLKRYTSVQMRTMFKRKFTTADKSPSVDGTTSYQRFFSQFVAYADRPWYFSQFTTRSADSPSDPLRSVWVKAASMIPPVSTVARIKELPPEPQGKRQPLDDPYLDPFGITRAGVAGIWAANTDLWGYLYEQHRDKLIADARAHAVPTAEVDAKARAAKFNHLLEFGMFALNMASMFVPVLGEVMMTVMAGQLLYESFEGAIEWSEGDRHAAKAHLIDVAENLVMIGVMAGVGKGIGKLTAPRPVPLIESLQPIELPDGSKRLWKPDLTAYESAVTLDSTAAPDAQGLHWLGGESYIRQSGKVYQTFFDESLRKWRIQHPVDAAAYQPILEHNRLGAWRHSLERPRTWDRLTLLRRIGHSTEAFSDEQLLKIADVSGVSDDALRQMHVDNLPPPLVLADTLRLFEADRGVARIIDQVAHGVPLDDQYLLTLPLLIEMPRWPTGRILEVYDEAGLSGEHVKYGVESASAENSVTAAIQVTRADVLSGRLPERILASLDETETRWLLGGEAARVAENRPVEFRKQLAEILKTRQPAIFERLYAEPQLRDVRIDALQRATPGLGSSAATRVLLAADAEQLGRLQNTSHIPLQLLEESRWYAQQRRFDHAIAGLHMENLATTESKWLALHTLERLPGWQSDLRLEVRDGNIEGPLLDSVGSEHAAQRKILVKQGLSYQAFNDRGEALNSVPRQGDNFFASIMHALPDKSRQSLGFADVAQSLGLRRAVIEHVTQHRAELARLAARRNAANKEFKPPVRVQGHGPGYYASGRGQGVNPVLVSRVQDVYPVLSDEQAGGFILKYLASGKTDAQIYELLQRRMREWEALESTLAEWQGTGGVTSTLESMIGGRSQTAQSIKQSWRHAPLAEVQPHFRQLDLVCDDPLPTLSADFSHVQDLSFRGRGLTDTNADTLLKAFPNLKSLRINATSEAFSNIPHALQQMTDLRSLTLYGAVSFAPDMPTRLGQLVRLEELTVWTAGYQSIAFDVSKLQKLRRLEIVSYSLNDWPVGVLDLPALERLNLNNTGIGTLPKELFAGHEKLWSGLSLDWSRFDRKSFSSAYEYVKRHPEHLIDRESMVRDYCRGELRRLGEGVTESFENMSSRFFGQWSGAQQRFEAIEALSEQYALLDRNLLAWVGRLQISTDSFAEFIARSNATHSIRSSWRAGLFKRYGADFDPSTLDLSASRLTDLPQLPADGFRHVRTLYLREQHANASQIRTFVSNFTEVRTLDLSGNALEEVPIAPGSMARLSRLDLSGNQLTDSSGVQQILESLPALEHLDLHANPLTDLNVSQLHSLKAIDLRDTKLNAWPTGAEDLPFLRWLDLRNSQLATLPQTVLESKVLLNVNLTGAPLTPAMAGALQAAQRRIEFAIGLPDGALEAFAGKPVPPGFPPPEDAFSLARNLLPLPLAAVGQGEAVMLENLQRVQPALSDEQALQVIEQMRANGATSIEISDRIAGWNQTFETLVRQLNGWAYIRESRGADWLISSQTRNLAAWRILSCWRARLPGASVLGDTVLDLSGLQLGDMPALPEAFSHVRGLNLTGTRLTAEGSNSFLDAFDQLRTLELNGNELETLPGSVRSMRKLERLELSGNGFYDPELLYDELAGLEHLSWLDLSYNKLESFDASDCVRLAVLDLRNNNLVEWPQGVLEAEHLRTLNLSHNDISSIPEEAFDGSHDLLMDGTDLTDNYNLSEDSIRRLRAYRAEGDRPRALGFSQSDLEEMADDAAGGLSETTDSIESDEVLAVEPTQMENKTPWLANLAAEQATARSLLWDQVAAEPDSAAFFHLLERLQDTREFQVANADLTRRVWTVMEAAASTTELREVIFAGSTTHGTCVDGRILTFSGLESAVFIHNALLNLPIGRPGVKGKALLDLSRRLFRLDKVDELAKTAAAQRGFDEAEMRLGYRIGLTGGWDDGLELPGQPRNMTYSSGVTPQQLTDARVEIGNAEHSDRFLEDLIQRDYWVDYLKEARPEAFRKLNEAQLYEDVEDEGASADDPEYLSRLFDRTAERNAKLIELSREEIDEIGLVTGKVQKPDSSENPATE
jgi:Leucine-rich repeat (LRR) protein